MLILPSGDREGSVEEFLVEEFLVEGFRKLGVESQNGRVLEN